MAEHGVMLVQYRKAMRDIQRGSGRESFLPKGILCLFLCGPQSLRISCYRIVLYLPQDKEQLLWSIPTPSSPLHTFMKGSTC